MARFIAIPVARGDAFYLEREELSVLVDGGGNRVAFPFMFREFTKKEGVNVVVCTHNDADHANGIIGFLEAGLRCDEVWLPGRWLSTLPYVLRPYNELRDELIENIRSASSSIRPTETDTGNTKVSEPMVSPIEAYGESIGGIFSEDSESLRGVTGTEDSRLEVQKKHVHEVVSEGARSLVEGFALENGWPTSCLEMLEQAKPREIPPDSPRLWDIIDSIWWLCDYGRLPPIDYRLLGSAIETVARIRTIATEAFHRGIPVRWFKFNTDMPWGGESALRPLNAREIVRLYSPRYPPRQHTLLQLLTLTVLNKESLVFWSPPTADHPGVLFTADSDLRGVTLPSDLNGAIVTTPHHGSEANAHAYEVIGKAVKPGPSPITWVRSDGRYRSRPGDTFLRLASRRLCTLCRRSGDSSMAKQVVKLYSRRGAWIRHPTSRGCSCS